MPILMTVTFRCDDCGKEIVFKKDEFVDVYSDYLFSPQDIEGWDLIYDYDEDPLGVTKELCPVCLEKRLDKKL